MTTRYGQHCPVARASEVLALPWVPLIVRELLHGPATVDGLVRGLAGISRPLLRTRLRHLERAGILARGGERGIYRLSESGRDLSGVIAHLGDWGRRWLPPPGAPRHPEPLLLDICRAAGPMARPATIHLKFVEVPPPAHWWVSAGRDGCSLHRDPPALPARVRIDCTLRALSDLWLGHRGWRNLLGEHAIRLRGSREAVREVVRWLGDARSASRAGTGSP
ncbi:helix-turn-helix domain-containing protein [Amycolatopsis endophytica]|uniref:DNA-binding HxlR family transcriptional regulator n=1 Tax=Amycolatopsis endophytica TaxID=860233 RepID=A0A853B868_9PSEU|nr:helix-turn-helix domain-containing protein [Amycolatopsis endophytica]NYI91508.1 DNA-binding HxlR family transcriptional regulator [Amycolatopsis endophytica]